MIKQIYTKCSSGTILTTNFTSFIKDTLLLQHYYVYAQFDDEVCLGIFENGELAIKSGQSEGIKSINVDYISEIRFFSTNKELKLVRHKEGFLWRFREDEEQSCEGYVTSDIYEETHKLWGHVDKELSEDDWCLLTNQRGSCIYVPLKGDNHKKSQGTEKAIIVRNYLEILSAEKQQGLLTFHDARICDIVEWSVKTKEEVNHE